MSDDAFRIAMSSALAPFTAMFILAVYRAIKWCVLSIVQKAKSCRRTYSRKLPRNHSGDAWN